MNRALVGSLIAFITASAAGQTPVVRARLEPAKGILVGQPVRLIVSIFVPNYFTGSPDFPEFDMDNAIVVLPQDRPQNSNEKIGGLTYAGITETYTIYPQTPGDFLLPPSEIAVPYASAPPKTTLAHVALPSLSFRADVPAAARDLDYFLPTTGLTIQQKWSTRLNSLRVGDSIERTITVTATRMKAMLIPPLALQAPDGIRVYPEEPVVEDHRTDRGEFVFGRRTQSARYLIRKSGDYTLPPIELKWWSLSASRLETATLPAVHFTAAANPGYVAELPPEPETVPAAQPRYVSPWTRYKLWIRVVGPSCIGFVLLLWLCWPRLSKLHRDWQTWRRQQKHSERSCFRKLQSACSGNRASEAYERLVKWVALTRPGLTIDEFVSGALDPALASETQALGSVLFEQNHQSAQWNGTRMAYHLKQHRQGRRAITGKSKILPKLNP